MHYDDIWEKEHLEQFKRERQASQSRKQLLEILNAEEMVKIMFENFLYKLPDSEVEITKRNYVKAKK